ncbi:MAG: hypothetical protein AAFN79_00135 [Pseudomonadota bacterium]
MNDPDAPSEFLTVTMIARSDGALSLRSVEFIAPSCRARFSFGRDATVDEMMSERAAAAFKALADRITEQRGMLALPDIEIDLDELVLTDCRIVATDARDDGAQILVRFRHFTGDVFVLFAKDCAIHRRIARTPSENDHTLQLFEKAYMPLNDVAEHIIALERQLGGDQIGEALVDLAQRIKSMGGVADAKRLAAPPQRLRLH